MNLLSNSSAPLAFANTLRYLMISTSCVHLWGFIDAHPGDRARIGRIASPCLDVHGEFVVFPILCARYGTQMAPRFDHAIPKLRTLRPDVKPSAFMDDVSMGKNSVSYCPPLACLSLHCSVLHRLSSFTKRPQAEPRSPDC